MLVYEMLGDGMTNLTEETDITRAWRQFVSPGEVIGLKVNPIGGKLLSTSHALVKSVISQLELSGIPREQIIIFDRRMQQLLDAGFTPDNYPGISIWGPSMLMRAALIMMIRVNFTVCRGLTGTGITGRTVKWSMMIICCLHGKPG
jgi:hypothetical protein